MSEINHLRRNIRLLVLNPNSSPSMTNSMAAAIRHLPLPDSLEIFTYTAPPKASPGSIDDQSGIHQSCQAVLDDDSIQQDLESDKYDGVLVACFSVHSLVSELARFQHLAITGIFEASILTALSLVAVAGGGGGGASWGIVTTGSFWDAHLTEGVKRFVGQDKDAANTKFAGVFTTGLTAGEFHTISPEQVEAKLQNATRKLLEAGSIECVVMGCAGMAGLESIIRSTAIDIYGKTQGEAIYIVDGVKAGIHQLEQTVRSKRAFR